MSPSPDVLIVGSGIGGGTLAYRLVQHGLNVTILERGSFLPQEPQNWDVNAVFLDQKYVPQETWLDKDGVAFRPGTYYYVGGSSKMYGAAMLRLRERDFEALEHAGGVSPAWPVRYRELASYYDLAEQMYGVHGQAGVDPTEPPGVPAYPYPALDHEPVIGQVAAALKDQGIKAFTLPLAVQRHEGGPCVRCKTCDGFPCKVHAKTDAEVAAIKPALATGKLMLKTHAKAMRLVLTSDGKRVNAVEYENHGSVERITAPTVVLSASAVNSAALLLRSACAQAPQGVANSSGVVGRHYMAHNNTALMSIGWKINRTNFQKTICINDFYFGDDSFKFPMGNIQGLGKLQSGMLTAKQKYLPRSVGNLMAERSVDWWIMSEDLPDPENRVILQGDTIRLHYTPNNMAGHKRLAARAVLMMRKIGFKLNVAKHMGGLSVSHQCGTVRFGTDPGQAALNEFCRSFDHENLFVVDASFFPSSAAVNPALTIAAQAIRVADHMAKTDFGVR
ncbi:MAG TPA: GMC family oxidoreductase [Terriglobales bacterium]|jgi:choline dehydrogenase-like flavoprotein|nr:GMC family oxidoreductase [Terriglobales bacterium]